MWWWSVAAAQPCEAVGDLVDRATEQVLEANLGGAAELAGRAEAALGCGAVADPAQLGRLWVVSGVLAWIDGREGEARQLLAAGQRLAPGAWDPRFGADLTAVWSELEPDAGEGPIGWRPEPGAGWSIAVDGGPDARVVPAGLHLVQVHSGGVVAFGKVVWVAAGEGVQVSHTLPASPPPVVVPAAGGAAGEAPAAGPAAGRVAASLSLGAGLDVAGGERLDADAWREPGGKVSVPIELGARVEGSGLWFRAAVAGGPLVGGAYLYAADGVAARSVVAVGGHVAGGAQVGRIDVGALGGVQWPGRIPARLVVGVPLGGLPLRVEGRAGVNVATAGRLEGAGAVVLSYLPWL